jgi:hypothetical protein
VQALCVLAGFEDFARVAAFALEHGGGVVHGMRQNVDVCVAPFDQFAVHPDFAVPIIICASHVSSPVLICIHYAFMSVSDIKLRYFPKSLTLDCWNVNKADVL